MSFSASGMLKQNSCKGTAQSSKTMGWDVSFEASKARFRFGRKADAGRAVNCIGTCKAGLRGSQQRCE